MALSYFTFVAGTFVVVGKQPDGDSVRFIPSDPHALDDIYRAHLLRPSRTDGSLQLRLDGIDAPETHYNGHAQPFGDEARDHFLKSELGFRVLEYKPDGETIEHAEPLTAQGAILTKAADPHGRPICYLYHGDGAGNPFHGRPAGTVNVDLVKRSTNYRMVTSGFAYPLLYTSTPREHRAAFTATAQAARSAGKGVWQADATPRFPLAGFESIDKGSPEAQLIFPKIYRRCVDYLRDTAKGFDGTLIEWLNSKPAENDSVVIGQGNEVPLATLIYQENDRYRFDVDVTETVFVEK